MYTHIYIIFLAYIQHNWDVSLGDCSSFAVPVEHFLNRFHVAEQPNTV
jgi:hypothetical protein